MPLDETQQAAQAQFDRQAARYGRGHILSDTGDVADALGGIDNAALEPALDVATGAGHTAVYLASRGLRVTAGDLSAGMLGQTAQLAGEQGLTLQTAQHSAEELPYPDAVFGLVTCRVAAHHFSSVEDFLREAHRVLRPGGWLFLSASGVSDTINAGYARLYAEDVHLTDERHTYFSRDEAGTVLYMTHHFTTDELVGLLETAGFREISLTTEKESSSRRPDEAAFFHYATCRRP